MTAFNHNLIYNPVRGGLGIVNPVLGQFGTLGFIGVAPDASVWAVSCYHVLCRIGDEFPANVQEAIYYATDLTRILPIGLVSAAKAVRNLDCAAAMIVNMPAIPEILGIGRLTAPTPAIPGRRVLKSGAETGVSEGRILSVSETLVEIAPTTLPPRFDLSGGGDSGALWVDAEINAPVCLHTSGNDWGTPERAFGVPIGLVLTALGLSVLLPP